MIKKLISIFAAAMLLLSIIPSASFAANLRDHAENYTEQPESAQAESAAMPAQSIASRANERSIVTAEWNFETDPVAAGWRFQDHDGDTYNWQWVAETYGGSPIAASGVRSIRSCSYDNVALSPDNWAISPNISLLSGSNVRVILRYKVASYSSLYPEHYQIYVSTDMVNGNGTFSPVTDILSTPSSNRSFEEVEIDLSQYAGQTVSIAFRHYDSVDCYKMYIDDAAVICDPDYTPPVTEPPETEPPVEDGLIAGYYFESDPMAAGWKFVDSDGDGFNWEWYLGYENYANEGSGLIGSRSYVSTVGAIEPDNWAIVGPIRLRNMNNEFSFYARASSSYYSDEGVAAYIGTSLDLGSMEEIVPLAYMQENYTRFSANVDAYAGQEVYFAIRHFNCSDQDYLFVDQVEIFGDSNGEPDVQFVTSASAFNMDIPEYGAHPDFNISTPYGAHYSVHSVGWTRYDGQYDTSLTANDVFNDESSVYYSVIVLAPEDGWGFSPECAATINGNTSLVDSSFIEDGMLFIASVDFRVREPDSHLIPITSVYVYGYESPIVGENAADHLSFYVPFGANYFIVRDDLDAPCWWNEDTDLLFNGTFAAGTHYSAGITLIANAGYRFAEDCMIYVNDYSALVNSDYSGVDVDDETRLYVWTVPELAAAPSLLGDVDRDGDVDTADSLLVLRYAMGLIDLPPEQLAGANVNGDNAISMADSLLIQRYALGLIDSF